MNKEPELYMVIAAYEHCVRGNLEIVDYNLTKLEATKLRKRLMMLSDDPDNDTCDKLDYHSINPVRIVRQHGVI